MYKARKTVRKAVAVSLLLVGGVLRAQAVIWSGADATNNVNATWSDVSNWSGGTPGAGSTIYFFDAGANPAPGVVNNLVGSSTTIARLQYGNTNGFHTTQINSGSTLSVSNTAAANVVFVGTGTDNRTSETSYTTITGPGSFTIKATSDVGTTF